MLAIEGVEDLRKASFSGDAKAMEELKALSDKDPENPHLLKYSGIASYRCKDYAAAERLGRARTADQDDAEIPVYLMRAYYNLGEREKALEAAAQILVRRNNDEEALRLIGRVHNQMAQFEKAEPYWKRLADKYPADYEAPLQVARIASRLGKFDVAETYADLALRTDPTKSEAMQIKVNALLNSGRTPELADILPAYYALNPERALAAFGNIATPENAESLGKAIGAIRRQHGSDPAIAELIASSVSQWQQLALRKEFAKDDHAAAALFRAIRSADPDNRDAASGLNRLKEYGLRAMRQAQSAGPAEDVLQRAQEIVALDPTTAEAHFAIGRVHLVQGHPGDAVAPFEAAVAVEPDNAWFVLNLGRAQERSGGLETAVDAYLRVVELIADEAHEHVRESLKSIGNIGTRALHNARQFDYAEDHEATWGECALLLRTNPQSEAGLLLKKKLLQTFQERIGALYKTDDPDLRPAIERYLAKDADNASVLLMFGRTLMHQHEHTTALPVWEKLVEAEPGNAHYLLQVARCCAWLKLPEKGIAAATAALACDPSLEEAQRIAGQLAPSPV